MPTAVEANTNPPPPTQRGLIPALLWACFLGCSWTWIIGMLFPVLLLRDYGAWGWVVFAIPNVLGAAAMGTVLWKPEWSARIAEKHRDMGLRFSEVTIAYHGFVLGWLMMRQWGFWMAGSAIGATLIVWSRIRSDRSAGYVGVMVAAASALWLIYGQILGGDGAWVGVFKEVEAIPPRLGTFDLIMFAPAAVLGFLCCPYLDLTFHRARRATEPLTGALAFAIGFGVVFLAMIVGTLMYAGLLLPALASQPFELPETWNVVLAVHLTIQLAFTVAVHGHEVASRGTYGSIIRMALIALAAIAIGWMIRGGASMPSPAEADAAVSITTGETIYRLFLLCYGLVFPAYVWLCMIPTLRPTNPRTRKAIFILGAVLCVPMGWQFFIASKSAWIIAIVSLLIALRVIVETTPRYIEAPIQSPPKD